ncbi:hypothetical protein IU454_08100 [Nocardia farcinica]|uniref:hypothetical protein n=1 Tax=Nocardia farcinica TaxID=37329 RepID=UPI001893DCEC|nr:hypothetical protein [Nocardia farcinica]MBF6291825.1 hypothetical protein [Nocardia farcinica]
MPDQTPAQPVPERTFDRLSDEALRRHASSDEPDFWPEDRLIRLMAAELLQLRQRVTELEGELGPLRTQRSAAYAILASIAAELGAEEETRWECLPEMARALATRKINPDTVLWAPTQEGQADA